MNAGKRFFLLLTLLLTLALLVACGGGDETSEEMSTEAAPAPTQEVVVPTTAPEAEATLPPPPVNVEEGGETDGGETAGPETSAPESAELSVWPADRFGYGIQIHGDATYGNQPDVADVLANRLGMQWVKMQIRWDTVHPEQGADQWFFYDATLEEMHKAGLYVMVSILDAPDWARSTFGDAGQEGPPDDYQLYVDFVNEVLQRHGDKIQAVEVWNEQNLDREWLTANGVNATDYVELLRRTHEAIKAYDSNIIVISGALSPTGVNEPGIVQDDFAYMDAAIAAGMLDYADCVGAHHNGINLPPNVPFDEASAIPEAQTASFRGPFDNPDHSWSFYTTLNTYAEKVQAVDPEMKLCVTEFGWASGVDYGEAPEGFGFALDNTVEEQADYIVQAYNQMYDSGDVWLAFLFNFDFGNKIDPMDSPVFYSILDRAGAPRPAFDAIASMEKRP